MIAWLYDLGIEPFASFGFMRVAFVGCVALALAQGPIGTMLLMRRMALVGNVLSHAVMPGAALGFLAAAGYSLAALSLGGLITGLVVAGLAGLVGRIMPDRQDAGLAAFYLVSLALGVTIVSIYGSNSDLAHVLFGTVLAIDLKALLLIAGVSSLTLLVLAAIYRPLVVDSFDPAFLRAVGGGRIFGAIFVFLVVLNLVASFQALGTLLAVGLMLLPAAAARCWVRQVGPTMMLSVIIGASADYLGLLVSYHENLPSGPAIVLAGGVIYALSLLAADLPRRLIAGR